MRTHSPAAIAWLQRYLAIAGLAVLFWWPVSHWFYPEWYHALLGFASYDPGLVKIIGTTGFLAVANIFLAAWEPVRFRPLIIVLIGFSILLIGTYIHLIRTGQFPPGEYVNVGILALNAIVLAGFLRSTAARQRG